MESENTEICSLYSMVLELGLWHVKSVVKYPNNKHWENNMNKPMPVTAKVYNWYDIAAYIEKKYDVDTDNFRCYIMEMWSLSNGNTGFIDFTYFNDQQFAGMGELFMKEFGNESYITFSW